jgi:hypothetical protein
MTLLSNATILRGIACTRVKYMQKNSCRFFMLAVYWQLKISNSDTLHKMLAKKEFLN